MQELILPRDLEYKDGQQEFSGDARNQECTNFPRHPNQQTQNPKFLATATSTLFSKYISTISLKNFCEEGWEEEMFVFTMIVTSTSNP